jgi:predicted NAD/FAD-dependent oxidoreductase
MSMPDVIVVGAGIAGLSCAKALARAGARVRLIEKSRGVGGRCATRRVGEQPVDHGIAFYHGSDPELFDALRESDEAGLIDGWPHRLEGEGHPCQPRAFKPNEWRCAFTRGVNRFPKSLAEGLDIVRNSRVESIRAEAGEIQLRVNGAWAHRAPSLVVALPAAQARGLLTDAGAEPSLVSARALLEMVGSSSCLTLLAGYPLDAASPGWDVCYPEESRVMQLAIHDSAKRTQPPELIVVYQGLPSWSKRNLGMPKYEWTDLLLQEAGQLFGRWAAVPEWAEAHAWRYARADHGSEFTSPVLLELNGGARIGLAGEAFGRGGGVQAAWSSGRRLARRLIQEDRA